MARKRRKNVRGRSPADFARRFPENGMKLLLEDPPNGRELMNLTKFRHLSWIHFDEMKRLQTTFVQRDYRNVEYDVVLTAPFGPAGQGGKKSSLLIYILFEHQSEPDELMPFRMLEYVVQIYRHQERQWRRKHGTVRGIRFEPVLPVVFYTGTRSWENPGKMADLVERAAELGAMVPEMEPQFVNLSGLSEQELSKKGAFFGQLLRVVQHRQQPLAEFRSVLQRAVSALEGLRSQNLVRWQELLSYLMALVYHDRVVPEQPQLQELIESTVHEERERQRMKTTGKTIAEALREEGEKRGELRTLRRVLRKFLQEKFGEIPAETLSVIKATSNPEQLEQWLEKVYKVRSLQSLKITPPS